MDLVPGRLPPVPGELSGVQGPEPSARAAFTQGTPLGSTEVGVQKRDTPWLATAPVQTQRAGESHAWAAHAALPLCSPV